MAAGRGHVPAWDEAGPQLLLQLDGKTAASQQKINVSLRLQEVEEGLEKVLTFFTLRRKSGEGTCGSFQRW